MSRSYKTKSITFSGLATSLIVVLLFIASVIDVLDYTVSAICGIVITFVLIEFGTSYAISSYLGASILSIAIVPNKVTVVLFVAFCGWYPFLKRYLEKIKEPFSALVKLIVFNISLLAIISVAKIVFLLTVPLIQYIILFILGNVIFVLYDVLITKLIWIYVHKYRSKLKFLNK